MAATTIDLLLEVNSRPWPPARAPERSVPSTESPNVPQAMWGFDEFRERERFGLLERRLLELEIELFADFGVQFAVGARECVRRLFVACPSVRVPSVSAQPDGQLVCTWTNARWERLTVRCAGLSSLQYSIVSIPIGKGGPADHAWGSLSEPSFFWDENPVARRIAE